MLEKEYRPSCCIKSENEQAQRAQRISFLCGAAAAVVAAVAAGSSTV